MLRAPKFSLNISEATDQETLAVVNLSVASLLLLLFLVITIGHTNDSFYSNT